MAFKKDDKVKASEAITFNDKTFGKGTKGTVQTVLENQRYSVLFAGDTTNRQVLESQIAKDE